MKSEDAVGTIFVNTVVGRGSLNGVINVSFSTFNFTPNDEGQIDVDPVISCRLRMDKMCAAQLRDVMNELLATIEKAEQNIAPDEVAPKVEGISTKRAEKMN